MTLEKKNYRGTINLPKTDFPMKANLPASEPLRLKEWESSALYKRIRAKQTGKPKYILHDGPPYANGNIHAGHALNKILKDIIVKYKAMRGFDAHYVPGWDCHGMPIEHAIFKEMGMRKEDVNQLEFRKKAREYAGNYIQIQREEFKRLGIFGDWDDPYLTMSFDYQAKIAESFLSLTEKGFIYQGLKPVPWCFDCETALADAELEYEDKTSAAIYVALEVVTRNSRADEMVSSQPNKMIAELAGGKKACVLIWTTTPWTLPANVAIAFNPNLSYSVFEAGSNIYIAAENLVQNLKQKFGLNTIRVLKNFIGKELKHLVVNRVFGQYGNPPGQSVGILADFVSSTDGTGIVHIAPGHGEDDYEVGKSVGLLSPVNEKGKFTAEFKECEGVHVQKANQKIIELLREKKALLFQENYRHSYPHCWRCKNPVIFRATKQWFLKVSDEFRSKLSDAIQKNIQFIPEWGKNRIGSMVEVRPDWCLSRQRLWGVPIPIVSCGKCGKLLNRESKPIILEKFKKESSDVWFSACAADFLTQEFKCACGSSEFKKESDIIDVWFDSGVSHQAVLKNDRFGLCYPAQMYLEGSDQHRGWFQSALITSMALEGKAPYDLILTHGFVVDGAGKKMSKSAGNVVAPQDVMKEYGADILRLWVASCDYGQDVRLSNEILTRIADAYRKIRNTFRFLLGNLNGFDPAKDQVELSKLDPVDQYILAKSNDLFRFIQNGYETFDFLKCFQWSYELCNVHLSSFYLDVVKDRLYTSAPKSVARRSAQTAIWMILRDLVKLLAPILPFTCDEAWRLIPNSESNQNVHETGWPDLTEQSFYQSVLKDWEYISLLHKVVLLKLEEKRIKEEIKASLDAKAEIIVKDKESFDVLKKYEPNLRFYYIVSQLELKHGPTQNCDFDVAISRADGTKCVRCWNYSVLVGKTPEHPELCERCVDVMKLLEFQ